jgi:hypothetical protein
MYMQVTNRATSLLVRREEHEGRAYLVAPVVILREGVHNGSQGPLFYPLEELATFPMAWNGVPVTVGHPAEGSANSPAVLDRVCVGRLFSVNLDGDRLRGEIWVDAVKCQARFPEVISALNNNTPLEVSTGLFTEDEQTVGTWNGEEYQAIARRFRPDHLALLPGGQGACNWQDGCGVRLNQTKEDKEMLVKYNHIINAIGATDDLRKRVDGVREAIDRLDSPVAMNFCRAVYENSVIYEVCPGHQASSGMTRKFYKRDYTVDSSGAVVLGNDLQEVTEQREFIPVGNQTTQPDCGCGSKAPQVSNEEGGKDMAKNSEERKGKVFALLAINAGFTEVDREMLEGLECNQFAAIEALAKRPASIPAPAIIDNETALLNAVSPDLKTKVEMGLATYKEKRDGAITTIKANTANPFTDEQLGVKDLNELQALAKLASQPAPTAPATNFAANAGDPPAPAKTTSDAKKVEILEAPKINWENK